MPHNSGHDEWRIRQAASSDEFVATDETYRSFYDRMQDKNTSATVCAKYYVDYTMSLAAKTGNKEELKDFVAFFGGNPVELAARTHYRNTVLRTKLVEFVWELQKAVIRDPRTGEPLQLYEEQESVIWKDLPGFWLACAEEHISFVPSDPTNTPREMERWKNLSAFWAHQSSSPSTWHGKHALGAFLDAFGPFEEGEQTGNRDFLLQTACIYLICGMEWIWPRVQEGTINWGRKKWEWWKQNLENAQRSDNEEETKTLIREALLVMEQAEKFRQL